MTFAEKVYGIVKRIPRGKTLTYGEVARMAGKAKAYRAVGMILSKNWDKKIPCHRVIRSDGSLGGYNRGVVNKSRLLARERALADGRGRTMPALCTENWRNS